MTFGLEKAREAANTYASKKWYVDRDYWAHLCAEQLPFLIAEIKRLRAENRQISKAVIEISGERDLAQAEFRTYHKAWEDGAARIKELEEALVEGLTNFLHYRASCYDPARRCPYAKECDDCSTWDACGHVEKFRSEARQLLQADGKIGPGDT